MENKFKPGDLVKIKTEAFTNGHEPTMVIGDIDGAGTVMCYWYKVTLREFKRFAFPQACLVMSE